MLVPLRWVYDLFFRMTLNRLHFNIAMSIRPRDIANSLDASELDELEEIGANIGKLEFKFKSFRDAVDDQVEKEFKSKSSYPLITTLFKFIKRNYYIMNVVSTLIYNCHIPDLRFCHGFMKLKHALTMTIHLHFYINLSQ